MSEQVNIGLNAQQQEQLEFLEKAGVFYGRDDNDPDVKWGRMINLNDTFWWASAYCQEVKDEDISEVYGLFWNYGWIGILYWCAKKGDITPEFEHVRRQIDFVKHEEEAKEGCKSASEHAYKKIVYTLGDHKEP